MSDEAARALWQSRFELGMALVDIRGGVREGARNSTWWPLANALAWSCSGVDQLNNELAALHQDLFQAAGWSRAEAMASAASVKSRMKSDRLYKMRSSTFLKALEATPSELVQLSSAGHLPATVGHNAQRSEWDEGVMGFQKMKDLSFDAFLEETRRRQAEAGRRSAEVRSTTRSEEVKELARRLAAQGMTTREIGLKVGVSHVSVVKWLKT